jgi:Bacterial extracellular solute-binding protein.
MRKTLSMLLALLMLACAAVPAVSAAEEEPYWEIQIYSELANYSGLQTGWFAKLLKDKFNVGFNIVTSSEGGSDRFATQLISGNLGDLIFLAENNGQEHLATAIEAGLIKDLSGIIDEYAPNISNNYPLLLEKARIQFGGGEKSTPSVRMPCQPRMSFRSTAARIPGGAPTAAGICTPSWDIRKLTVWTSWSTCCSRCMTWSR